MVTQQELTLKRSHTSSVVRKYQRWRISKAGVTTTVESLDPLTVGFFHIDMSKNTPPNWSLSFFHLNSVAPYTRCNKIANR